MNRCEAYLVNSCCFFVPSVSTKMGVCVLTEPIEKCEIGESSSVIGAAVLRALGTAGAGDASFARSDEVLQSLVKQAGLRSWRAFSSKALLVVIEQEKRGISLIPMMRKGGGYRDLPGARITSGTSEAELGLAVARAFEACTIP